jgi:hypothetical protein
MDNRNFALSADYVVLIEQGGGGGHKLQECTSCREIVYYYLARFLYEYGTSCGGVVSIFVNRTPEEYSSEDLKKFCEYFNNKCNIRCCAGYENGKLLLTFDYGLNLLNPGTISTMLWFLTRHGLFKILMEHIDDDTQVELCRALIHHIDFESMKSSSFITTLYTILYIRYYQHIQDHKYFSASGPETMAKTFINYHDIEFFIRKIPESRPLFEKLITFSDFNLTQASLVVRRALSDA